MGEFEIFYGFSFLEMGCFWTFWFSPSFPTLISVQDVIMVTADLGYLGMFKVNVFYFCKT